MNPKSSPGTRTLDELERSIRYEEAVYERSKRAAMDPNGNQNLIYFEQDLLDFGRLKLTTGSQSAPPGHAKEWEATLLVQGTPRLVQAWRKVAAGAAIEPEAEFEGASNTIIPFAALTELSEAEATEALVSADPEPPFTVQGAVLAGPPHAVAQIASPNHGGRLRSRRFLILHYTGGTTLDGTVRWFLKPEAKASAHIVIARDGSVVQMVPLDRVAWHAGVSRWGELNGLNAWSIGIELVNAGKLKRHGDRWVSWAGTTIPNSEVQIARHSLDSEATGWHAYTEKQIEVCFEVARALHAQFSFQDLLGHDDVAPERKRDPGPAFPLEAFRARLFGRA